MSDTSRIKKQVTKQPRTLGRGSARSLTSPSSDEYNRVIEANKPASVSEMSSDTPAQSETGRQFQEEQARLKTILETVQTGIVVIDPQTHTIVDVNPAAAELIGDTRERIVGAECHRFICPAEKGRCPVTDLHQHVDNSERVLLTADGNERQILKTVVPVMLHGREHLLESFVDITERKLLERRQHLFTEILSILNAPLSMADTINHVLAVIKLETGFDAVGLRLKNGDDFPYYAQDGFSDDFLLTENTLVVLDKKGGVCRDKNGAISLECTCGLVISGKTDPANPLFTSGGSFWINNSLPLLDMPVEEDPRLHPRNRCIHDGFLSVALIPIRANQEIVGLLHFNDHKANRLTLEMVEHFEDICTGIGLALMQRQSQEALRESEERHKALFESTHDAIMTLEPPSWAFKSCNQATVDMFRAKDAQAFTSLAPWEASPEFQSDGRASADKAKEMIETAMREGSCFFEWTHRRIAGEDFSAEVLLSRVEQGGKAFLQAAVHDITKRKRAENELILNHDMQTAMNALLRLSMEEISTTEFLDRSLDMVLSLKWLALLSKGSIFLADETNELLRMVAHRGYGKELLTLCSVVPFGHCMCGKAAKTRTIAFSDCLDEQHNIRFDGMMPHGHYCVPILSGDNILGVLTLWVKESHTRTSREEAFLKSIANILAATIDRKLAQESLAVVAERDRHIAEVLQRTLIPNQMPAQPQGYEIAARYKPALSEAEVCGDFYDILDLGQGKLGIAVGDVAGKGLLAAVRVATVRHALRSYAFMGGRPSRVMTLLGEVLDRDAETENHTLTAFFATLDISAGELKYANAGHEPPLLASSDGRTEYLTAGGPMFSGLTRSAYTEATRILQAGDVLVMVTDGITESRKADHYEQFGPEGIERCLSENVGASAEEIASAILRDASEFAEGILRDDVVVLVIRKLGKTG